jgi:tRNA(adenine34) deaminase
MRNWGSELDYQFFMDAALKQARKALSAGEFPVGCVLVYEDRILVTGARAGTAGDRPNETDHAEMVAIRRLEQLATPVDRSRIKLFCTLEPCLMCFGATLLSGIGEIVYAYEDVMGGGTHCDLSRMPPLYRDNPMTIVPDILRDESLRLFKAYFADPGNAYWRESLLSTYTLAQPGGARSSERI